jgi:signal transduction histidine kinase
MVDRRRIDHPDASLVHPPSDMSQEPVPTSIEPVVDNRLYATQIQLDHWQTTIRQHVLSLQGEHRLKYCVVVCNENDTVLDMLGEPQIMSQLQADGIEIGTFWRPIHQTDSLESGTSLSIGSHRLTTRSLSTFGTVYVVSTKYSDTELLQALAQSIGMGVNRLSESDVVIRNQSIVQQAVLSHLDYHVILISPDGTTRAYHPIPLADTVRLEMLQFAKDSPDTDRDITLGDRLYSVAVCTLSHPDGSSPGRVSLFRDITEKRQMESRMRDTDRVSALASLSAGIAHEIRNPLTTARGFLQLFAERHISDTDRRYIDLTIQELDRIQKLVKDFMSLARPEQRELQHVELNHVIEEVIDFMNPEANLCGVTINLISRTSPLHVNGDVNQLKQVLLNVLQNALHASHKDSEIRVRTEMSGSYNIISVEDTGVGMSPEQQARAFQPFYTTKDAGTGLGLPICRQILKEHGGGIQIHSKLGAGTTVTLKLPELARPHHR